MRCSKNDSARTRRVSATFCAWTSSRSLNSFRRWRHSSHVQTCRTLNFIMIVDLLVIKQKWKLGIPFNQHFNFPPSPLHDLIKENKTINTINSKTIIHRRKYNFICKHNLATNETAGFQSRDAEGPRDESCQLKACQLPRNSAETNCTTSPGPSTSCRYLNRATKSCCRHRLMICAINYSGLASELGLYYRLS